MLEQILAILDLDRGTIISTFIGVIAGGLVNAYFARRGSEELRHEAGVLRDHVIMLINLLDDAGVIEVERDEQGNPIRVVKVQLVGIASGRASMRGDLTVGQTGDEDSNDEPEASAP